MHFSAPLSFALFLVLLATAVPSPQERAPAVDDAFKQQVVDQHNAYRRQYGAPDLTWSDALYTGTLQWASACKFTHSGGAYGENLVHVVIDSAPYSALTQNIQAAGTASTYGLTSGLTGWMNEASLYDYNNPGFSSATGHFTQVVWKNTKQVACAVANCPASSLFGAAFHYLVCRYTPAGNVIGQFPQNVGHHQ